MNVYPKRCQLAEQKGKILVLSGHQNRAVTSGFIEKFRESCEVVEAATIDQAIDQLRREHFLAVFSDADDFLPLERALVGQQASLILNTIGEGICIVDGDGHCSWMNKKMLAWPARVHEKVRRTCQEAYNLFATQSTNLPPDPAHPAPSRSKRYTLNLDDQQFMEMICSPVVSPGGQVVQVVSVVWDATSTRRLQQKIDAIDKAGSELVRLESDLVTKMNVTERLKLLEDKIISFTRELMHFDHFAIRLLDRKANRLEMVMSAGLPQDALNVELFSSTEGNGISGYVASTGRSYICPDVERDPRYITGLDFARSSLTVPLRLHDKVIGIFNIESRQRAAFNEDDRQFAEIFGRYVAIALNILNLLVTERVETSHKVTDTVNAEVAGPLNDIASDIGSMMDDYIGHDDLRAKLKSVLENVNFIRTSLRQAAEGPNTILGAKDVQTTEDPIIAGARVLVVDDEPNIRATIADILRKYGGDVTVGTSGQHAIDLLKTNDFDLIFSDIKMPDKTGYDVFAASKKKPGPLPVILMTGFGYDPNHCIVRASQEGLAAVLFKPFKVDQLLTEVRRALASNKAHV
ncbi:MAG: putative response regulator receiver protein [Phycisphaerales bacterium]|nr:putative response regulator receiver protein [Phycisphaerales bacterium]